MIAAGVEIDAIEAAVGRRDLILAADRLLEQLLLDEDRLAREEGLGAEPLLIAEEGVQEGDREGRAGAEAGLGRADRRCR